MFVAIGYDVAAGGGDTPVEACDLNGLEISKVGVRCPCFLGGHQCELVCECKRQLIPHILVHHELVHFYRVLVPVVGLSPHLHAEEQHADMFAT